jgi:hypothetical protein
MSAYEQWQAANNRYLAAQLASLRDRMGRLAGADTAVVQTAPAAEVSATPPRDSRLRRLFRRDAHAYDTPSSTPSPAVSSAPAVHEAISDDAEVTPALVVLAQRLGLSDFERDLLLLCAAMELDTRIALLCARAQHDASKPYPTFALAMALFDQPAWDAMSPERPLRYWRLIEISQLSAQPLVGSALRADERIVSYLKGANYLDDRVAPLLNPLPDQPVGLPASQGAAADTILRRLHAAPASAVPIVQLLGADAPSKQLVAAHVAAALDVRIYRIGADGIPGVLADQETLLRLWQRECALLPLALYIDALDTDRLGAAGVALQRALARFGGLVFLDVREPWPGLDRATLPIDIAKPTPAEQRQLWLDAIGEEHAQAASRPAVHFDFDATTIRNAAGATLALARDDPAQLPALLWAQCLACARPVLDQLAQPVEAKARWDDLELPAAEKSLLRQIADQVEHRGTVYDDWGFRAQMNRGLGISVLFSGESGTGKTMAAEVIANELGLLLYRIDLSAVVNKYIGETEKNLRRLFDAAEGGGAILLFDEADALFGKRGEVKDSHDRYSNIEVNYLLQRMEAFRGLAILATNMKSALDHAFLRRLRFIVRFPFPGVVEREAIWRKALPAAIDTGVIDFARLARFNLTGASIHSIALNAAFLAARARMPLGMPMLLDAARCEFRKLEKPVNETDFRWLERAENGT